MLFELMEKTMTPFDTKCFEKLFCAYLVKVEKFKELIEMELPDKFRNNQIGVIYLIDVLKAIFDNCIVCVFTRLWQGMPFAPYSVTYSWHHGHV